MRRKISTVLLLREAFMLALIWPLLCLYAPGAGAQDFHIRVLDGRNGKPITKECLNIWVGTLAGPHLVAATDQDGVVVLRVSDDKLVAGAGCKGWPVQAAWPAGADAILVAGDYYVACQEYANFVPNAKKPKFEAKVLPMYSLRRILESGVSASNTCGKFRAGAKSGELIFYVRPRSFMEKMRQ
jgi:hypothetical protein